MESGVPSRRGRKRRRIKRSAAILAVECLCLSHCGAASRPPAAANVFATPSISSPRIPGGLQLQPQLEGGAFVFSLLKSRRGSRSGEPPAEPKPAALTVETIKGDAEGGLIQNGVTHANGSNGRHAHYLGDTSHARTHQMQSQYVDVAEDEPYATLQDIDVVEDEPYADMHPIQNAYTKLSSMGGEPLSGSQYGNEGVSLDSMEGVDDAASYVREDGSESVSLDSMEGVDDAAPYARATPELQTEETASIDDNITTEGKSSLWARRNARSIDEGIRFKSQLREGLEEQTKQHRERLLSNLMDGVIGGTTSAFEEVTIKNVTNPFRWLGFGRGDKGSKRDVKGEASSADDAKGNARRNDAYTEINFNPNNNDMEVESNDKPNSQNFGARTIAGLIMALAEEVEGLEVKVDADDDTPIWDKTLHSIKIYFSRLGFRQLRMGGLDEAFSELETSMAPSEKFAMAKSFFNVGKPTTADEAFDKMDADNSGALDEEELAEALKMAAVIGGNKFGTRSKDTLSELASRLVRLYDTDGDGVVDREEYQAMVADMAALRDSRLKEELHDQTGLDTMSGGEEKKKGWFGSLFRAKEDEAALADAPPSMDGENIIDVTDNEEFWGSMDQGEGSIVLEDLKLDLRRLLFGAIPGMKRVLPGGPLILKPFTATITASFNKDDIMDSTLMDIGLRRLVARALNRRVRGIRDLLDGAVFYGRTWKHLQENSPNVEVAKLEDVHFDRRNRLIITGRVKIKETLGYRHEPIENGFKLRTKIGTRANGRIIGLLQPEIAIFAECPKGFEKAARTACKEWFGYTIPTFQPLYTYIPLVSPLKKDDKMDGFNMGEDNQIKSIEIKNGKLRLEFQAFLRPGRFLGNHYIAFTVPNRTLILTLDKVRMGMRNARRNKRLAELAAREVKQLEGSLATGLSDDDAEKPSISPEGKVRIRNLEKELKATIQEEAILREMEADSAGKENGKSFISRFVEGYSGVVRDELDLEMNARLSSSISDFFGSQDTEEEEGK
ncbi:hypothetical protein ACHAXT_012649 [Thalassiosira profunda]